MIADENTDKEKRNFLAAYHILKFSKADETSTEAVDIERRCLAAKYMTAKKFESEEMASCVLRRGLEDYQMLMEDKLGVNNYWKQLKIQTQKVNNDPRKWTSELNDVKLALGFVKPLPCQQDNTMPCHNKVLTDGYVRTIVDMWKNQDTLGRNKKISAQEKSNITKGSSTDNANISEEGSSDSQVSLARRQMPKSHPNTHEAPNFPRQHSVKFEQTQQPKFTNVTHSSASMRKTHYEQSNPHKGNVTPNPQVSLQQSDEDVEVQEPKSNGFRSARAMHTAQQAKSSRPSQKKTLGGKAPVNSKFVCPLKREKEKSQGQENAYEAGGTSAELEDERLKNIEPKMVELITNEIMDAKTTICWDDIAGLEYAKKIIKEVVVYPMLRPDIFTGLRRPPKGILLFGPPGTGKTLIGKCIASQSKSTFFSISASSLTSKWIGEGEKMVRALFAVARVYQPSVIFVDEIDSLLTQRSETEHESSRRLKTEFLVQLDGAATAEEDRILIVGATNRPHELDEAARRRLVKRLYVPLPELPARKQIINNLLLTVPHDLTDENVTHVAEQSKGYSGADMSNLCKEASMGPIRSIPFSQLENIRKEDVRHVTVEDFREALIHVRPSVSESSLSTYVEWDSVYGTGTAQNYKVLR